MSALTVILGLCLFLGLCALAGAILALIEADEQLGEALRFEIPPWS